MPENGWFTFPSSQISRLQTSLPTFKSFNLLRQLNSRDLEDLPDFNKWLLRKTPNRFVEDPWSKTSWTEKSRHSKQPNSSSAQCSLICECVICILKKKPETIAVLTPCH